MGLFSKLLGDAGADLEKALEDAMMLAASKQILSSSHD